MTLKFTKEMRIGIQLMVKLPGLAMCHASQLKAPHSYGNLGPRFFNLELVLV